MVPRIQRVKLKHLTFAIIMEKVHLKLALYFSHNQGKKQYCCLQKALKQKIIYLYMIRYTRRYVLTCVHSYWYIHIHS